jgi:hypothetical protein
MLRRRIILLRGLRVVAGLALATAAGTALAEANDSSGIVARPTFGSRTETPDGSVALTMGRRLPTEWEAKVGTDIHLARPVSALPSENLLRGAMPAQSSGAIWGNLTMPGGPPLGWDKTCIEARIDAGKEQGKLAAILSRSLPIGEGLSMTLQNAYSVTQSLAERNSATLPAPATDASRAASTAEASPILAVDQSVRFDIKPSGTTLSAGAASSTVDDQWHRKLSVEQALIGPLKLTTSLEGAANAASSNSIRLGFKRAW